jgi:hypothetical protein
MSITLTYLPENDAIDIQNLVVVFGAELDPEHKFPKRWGQRPDQSPIGINWISWEREREFLEIVLIREHEFPNRNESHFPVVDEELEFPEILGRGRPVGCSSILMSQIRGEVQVAKGSGVGLDEVSKRDPFP